MQIVLLTSVQYTVQLSIFFSTRLIIGFSVVQYFYINNEQYHPKSGTKLTSTVSILSPLCSVIITPYAQETQQILPTAFILPFYLLSDIFLSVFSALSGLHSKEDIFTYMYLRMGMIQPGQVLCIPQITFKC